MRGAWTIAAVVAVAVHAPLAFALLGNEPTRPVVRPANTPGVSVDLKTWRPPVRTPETRSKPLRAGVGTRAAGRGSRSPSPRTALRARPVVRGSEQRTEPTPAARELVVPGENGPSGLEPVGAGARASDSAGGGARDGGTRVFEVGEVDVAPRKLSGEEPVYPRLDATAGREGFVTLRFLVGEDGAVSGVEVQKHEGPRSLVEAAIEAVRGWRFSPARRSGHAVACLCLQRLTFHVASGR